MAASKKQTKQTNDNDKSISDEEIEFMKMFSVPSGIRCLGNCDGDEEEVIIKPAVEEKKKVQKAVKPVKKTQPQQTKQDSTVSTTTAVQAVEVVNNVESIKSNKSDLKSTVTDAVTDLLNKSGKMTLKDIKTTLKDVTTEVISISMWTSIMRSFKKDGEFYVSDKQ